MNVAIHLIALCQNKVDLVPIDYVTWRVVLGAYTFPPKKTASKNDLKCQFPLYRFYTTNVHVFILIPNRTHFLPEGFLYYLKPKSPSRCSSETICSFIASGFPQLHAEQKAEPEANRRLTPSSLVAMCVILDDKGKW